MYIGQTGTEWNVSFLPTTLLAARKFLNFFSLFNLSHIDNLSEKKRIKGKPTVENKQSFLHPCECIFESRL